MGKALLRVQFALVWNSFAGGSRKKGARAGIAVAMVITAAAIAMMFSVTFDAMAAAYYEMGLGWFYFAFFLLVDFCLMLLGSVFTAKAQLFEAKDNAQLLAMPIPPGQILFSRMASLILVNGFFQLTVAVPAAVCWVLHCPVTPMGAAAFLLFCLCLPLTATAVSALVGWLISLATRGVRNKTLLTTVFTLAFLALYLYYYSKLMRSLSDLPALGAALAGKLNRVALLLIPGRAIAEGRLPDLLWSLAGMLLPFLLVSLVLSATYLRVLSANRDFARVVYREKAAKSGSAAGALYRRELARLASSSSYLVNSTLGVFAMIAGAVFLAVKGSALTALLSQLATYGFSGPLITAGLVVVLCFLSTMTTVTAPSISLEGRNLWIAQSLPVPAWTVLRAKLLLHLSLAVPAVLLPEAVLLILLRPGLPEALLILLVPPLFNVLVALIGLCANLLLPNLNWVTETAAVKNSAAVLIAIFGGWFLAAIPAVLCLAVPSLPPLGVLAGFGLLTALLSALLLGWCRTQGARIFQRL